MAIRGHWIGEFRHLLKKEEGCHLSDYQDIGLIYMRLSSAILNRTEGRIDAQARNEIDGDRDFRLTMQICVATLRLPGRMTVEWVVGWRGMRNVTSRY
ncbi:hypothetical protein BZK31_17885 [Pseudomonas floridensis]|uniref:Uncharacterized protein n=1 Tax=Pseudomonas floridensis TaxID=1958950 RepID=A0A1X0N3D8_9PSED|nr:hypothetical protein BZK31_17885 [Pseudomonas floridensis]